MAALKASEDRQTTAVKDLKTDFQLLRSDVKSLGDKMDSLLLLLAKGRRGAHSRGEPWRTVPTSLSDPERGLTNPS